jgi:hypothetical protein
MPCFLWRELVLLRSARHRENRANLTVSTTAEPSNLNIPHPVLSRPYLGSNGLQMKVLEIGIVHVIHLRLDFTTKQQHGQSLAA